MMKNGIKRLFCIFLSSLMLALSLCSCSAPRKKSCLTINESLVLDDGVFAYYLNEALFSGAGYTDEQSIEYATNLCLQYVSVNTFCEKNGYKMTGADKARVAAETNALWRVYGKYYTEIGTDRSDFFRIRTSEAMMNTLCRRLYDKGCPYEIPDDALREYFKTNYVSIRYFYHKIYDVLDENTYAALGTEQKAAYDKTKAESLETYENISDIASLVNSGIYTLDEAYMTVTGNVESNISLSDTVLLRDNNMFSRQITDAIFSENSDSAFTVTDENKSFVYFIYKKDISRDKELFKKYRDDILLSVGADRLLTDIKQWSSSLKAVRHTKQVDAVMKKIKNVDREKYKIIKTQES